MTWSSSGTCRGDTHGDPAGRDRGCQQHPPRRIPNPGAKPVPWCLTARLSARLAQGPPEVLLNLNCCDLPHLRQEGARTAQLQLMLQRPQKQGMGRGGDTPHPPARHPRQRAGCPDTIPKTGALSRPRIRPRNFYDPRNINKSQELSWRRERSAAASPWWPPGIQRGGHREGPAGAGPRCWTLGWHTLPPRAQITPQRNTGRGEEQTLWGEADLTQTRRGWGQRGAGMAKGTPAPGAPTANDGNCPT